MDGVYHEAAIIGDRTTVTGFILAGAGARSEHSSNFFVVNPTTTDGQISEALENFLRNPSIRVILIEQVQASRVRSVLSAHAARRLAFPAVLEIPSKTCPYRAEDDPIMQKISRHISEQ